MTHTTRPHYAAVNVVLCSGPHHPGCSDRPTITSRSSRRDQETGASLRISVSAGWCTGQRGASPHDGCRIGTYGMISRNCDGCVSCAFTFSPTASRLADSRSPRRGRGVRTQMQRTALCSRRTETSCRVHLRRECSIRHRDGKVVRPHSPRRQWSRTLRPLRGDPRSTQIWLRRKGTLSSQDRSWPGQSTLF